MDERDLHVDYSRVRWVAPIGFTTQTALSAAGFYTSLAGASAGTASAVGTSGGFIKLYCSAASGNYAGCGRSGIGMIMSDSPELEIGFRVASLTGQRFHFELHKDADEYITVRIASGGAVEYICNDKSGAASGAWLGQVDGFNAQPATLTVVKNTWYRMTLGVNSSGVPYLINHGSDGSRDVYTLAPTAGITITAGLYLPRAKVFSTAGGAAEAHIKSWVESNDIM